MDPQAPTYSSTLAPVDPPAPPEMPETPKDNHWITILAMALFVLASLAIVAFLYYQNQQLKGMLANYQTPTSSPSPTASSEVPAGWITYSGKSVPFSFSYPDDGNWKVNETQSGLGVACDSCAAQNSKGINNFGVSKSLITSLNDFKQKASGLGFTDLTNTTFEALPAVRFIQLGSTQAPTCVGMFFVHNNNGYSTTQCYSSYLTGITKFSDFPKANPDILSTLKFLDSIPSASPISTPAATPNLPG